MRIEKMISVYRVAVEATLKIVAELPDRELIEQLLNSSTDSRTVRLSAAQIEQLTDALLTEFMTRGLQPDHEPNTFGYEVEGWIDCLNAENSFREEIVTATSAF